MPTWLITYDDGDEFREETVTGKLSLDPTWVFVMDTNRTPSAVIIAIPAHRVIDVKEQR